MCLSHPKPQLHLKNGCNTCSYTSLPWGLNQEWPAHCKHSSSTRKERTPQPQRPAGHQPHPSLAFLPISFLMVPNKVKIDRLELARYTYRTATQVLSWAQGPVSSLFPFSLQCLNETLTSSTKEAGKAALEKQVTEEHTASSSFSSAHSVAFPSVFPHLTCTSL